MARVSLDHWIRENAAAVADDYSIPSAGRCMHTLWRYLLQALQAPLATHVTRVVNHGLGPAGTVLLQLRLDPRVPEAWLMVTF